MNGCGNKGCARNEMLKSRGHGVWGRFELCTWVGGGLAPAVHCLTFILVCGPQGIEPYRGTMPVLWFFFVSCGKSTGLFVFLKWVVDNSSLKPRAEASNLRAVVEVVPVVAGAHPVVVGGGVVGLVVGVSRGVVELAGLGVLAGGLGVEGGGGLTVESLEHLKFI